MFGIAPARSGAEAGFVAGAYLLPYSRPVSRSPKAGTYLRKTDLSHWAIDPLIAAIE